MNKSLILAACFIAGAGATAIGAVSFGTVPYQGSDTEYNITNQSILNSGLGNTSLATGGGIWNDKTNPLGDYAGGGSGAAETNMVGQTTSGTGQQTGPMSRMLKGGAGANACKAQSGELTHAAGIVIGIDAVRLFASTAAINANPAGACNGTAGSAAACTRDTVQGGLAFDNSSPSANNDAGVAIPFSNWRDVLALLYGGLDRTVTPMVTDCNGAKRRALVANWSFLFEQSCANPNGQALTHAWRRDDGSGTSDAFSSLIGITAASVDQFTNAIGGFSTSLGGSNGFGATPYCNAMNWDTAEVSAGVCQAGAANNLKHYVGPGGVPVPGAASGEPHHTLPAGVWGNVQPTVGTDGGLVAGQPQVFATSYQDNDPIRVPCAGNGHVNSRGEDVCNDDGNLGVVLPIPALDFIGNTTGLTSFTAATECTSGATNSVAGPHVYKCAPSGSNVTAGLCPNNDTPAGTGCLTPLGTSGGSSTTQCMTTKATLINCLFGHCGSDNRVYNLFSFTAAGGYNTYPVAEATGPVNIVFAGGFGRIHQREVAQTGLKVCQLNDATDNIGCLVQADPQSVGYAGNGADTWEARDPVAGHTGTGETTGLRVHGLSAGVACTPGTDATTNYPLWRKLYFSSIIGFENVTTAKELSLAEYESTAAQIAPVMAQYDFFVLPFSPMGADTSGAPVICAAGQFNNPPGCMPAGTTGSGPYNKPFCEDFNEVKNCAVTGTNSNACQNYWDAGSGTPVLTDPNYGTVPYENGSGTSTTCGNGTIDKFEDCDFNATTNPTGCGTCSATCRCSLL